MKLVTFVWSWTTQAPDDFDENSAEAMTLQEETFKNLRAKDGEIIDVQGDEITDVQGDE